MSPVRLPVILAILFMGASALAALTLEEARQIAPLPASSQHGGPLFTDLNNDGHDDLIVSNPHSYGVYLFNPVEKKNVQWDRGWSHVLREGRAGDANSLPLFVDAQGQATGLHFSKGALRKADGAVAVSLEELLRVPGPAPLSPKESFQALRVKPGYRASLIAHEPLVQDPIFMDWDSQGRLWVVEMGDYPFAPGETTRDGRLGAPQVSPLQTGRIKILQDTDCDGLYDRASLFLDGLRHPTGLAFWKGGVFISTIPDILYAEDTDGDGICDRREPWFTGFTAGNPQHLVNGFCWGLDGWFYGANGDSGGNITVLKTGQKILLGTSDFRFHPVTGEFQLEAGRIPIRPLAR
ncbi:PVC-type heme-binding CxxCH protein [Prosthecobacter sp. SYSU 5D2]|uniref:PVC-type heme-binding CxxCH protein n=1 Tax=Prosthecobacter sp. SYSU 5D2 TaxID=3134134 RepID=UPI0031FEBAC0